MPAEAWPARRRVRAVLVVMAALALGSLGAESLARLAAPWDEVVARALAHGLPWQIDRVGVRRALPDAPAQLELRATVSRSVEDPRPAALLIGKIPVAAAAQAPAVFWTLLALWPVRTARERRVLLLGGVPGYLALEAATTASQLLVPLAYASAALAGAPLRPTSWEHWSRFLEAGGRIALAVVLALGIVAVVTRRQRRPDRPPLAAKKLSTRRLV